MAESKAKMGQSGGESFPKSTTCSEFAYKEEGGGRMAAGQGEHGKRLTDGVSPLRAL